MARHLTVRPMNVGAEILDLPDDPGDPAVKAQLREAWLEYGLLRFHDITSIEQHLAASRAFGELELHPLVQMRAPEHELFMTVGGDTGRPYVYDESEVKVGTIPWHRDTAYTAAVAKGAMLRILETPKAGGQTFFADTANAYDDLPDELKARVAGLEYVARLKRTPMEQSGPGALWETVRPLNDDEWAKTGLNKADFERKGGGSELSPVAHPATIVHPESGRTMLFLSPKEFDFFTGLDRADSDALFKDICDHMLQDKYVYRHTYAVNDAMAWDNRRFMHAATGSRVGDYRYGLRTTLAGDFTVGRLYEPTAANA
jgi:taurine dioxygenase